MSCYGLLDFLRLESHTVVASRKENTNGYHYYRRRLISFPYKVDLHHVIQHITFYFLSHGNCYRIGEYVSFYSFLYSSMVNQKMIAYDKKVGGL